MKTFNEWIKSLNESGSPLNFSTDNLEELIAAIHRLPDTIRYINVTDRLGAFSPGHRTFAPADADLGGTSFKVAGKWHRPMVKGDPDWRSKAEDVLRELKAKTPKDEWDRIDSMGVRGHGGGGPKDSFYTFFSWPEEREFNDAMRAGVYGSLD